MLSSRELHCWSRRDVCLAFAASVAGAVSWPRRAGATPVPRVPHPDPRPGIDASEVLTAEQLSNAPDAVPIYDMIREIPQIADGIRCKCGCANIPGYRSLLTCYESGGMAKTCQICQAEARLVYRLHTRGRTLDQIRAAVDARYGADLDDQLHHHR